MPAINLPSSINATAWDKKAAKNDKAGVGEKLKDLAKLHTALDLSFADKLDKPEDVEAAKAKLEAIAKKQGPELQAAAREAVKAAKKNDNTATAKEAAAIAKDAEAYAQQVEKALANARTAIDKRAAEVAAAAKKNAGKDKDKDEDEEEDKNANATKLFKKASDFLRKPVRTHVVVPGKGGFRFMAVWCKQEMAAVFVGRPGASLGEAYKKKAAEHFKLPKPPNTFTIGEVIWDEDKQKYVFLCRGAIPPKKKIAKWLKENAVRPAEPLIRKLVKNKNTGKEEEEEAPEAEGEGTEAESETPETLAAGTAQGKDTPPEAPPKPGTSPDIDKFKEEVKSRLDPLKSKLASLDQKSMDQIKELNAVISQRAKNGQFDEARSALNRIVAIANAPAGGGAAPGASPALVQAQSAWSADVTKFRSEVNKLVASLDEIYREEPEQKAAVQSAKAALSAAAGKITNQLDTMLRAMMQGSPQQRAQLTPRLRSEVQSMRQALTGDKILSALDGNELNPSLSVIGPMRQRLQAIEAALQ